MGEHGGVLLHDSEGETDVSHHDGKAYVLPDFDRNGSNEILVLSTVSQILSIEQSRVSDTRFIRIVKNFYVGP